MNRQAGGIIYELRCCINNEWHPFYVGRTSNQRRRLNEHRNAVRTGTTLVYQFIREQIEPLGVAWDLFPVEVYAGDYVDQEDEHIMTLLYDGIRLKNMKKGDAEWMTRRIHESQDMVRRGIRSYRQYREIISLEEQTQRAEAKQQQWMIEDVDCRRSYVKSMLADLQITLNKKAEDRLIRERKKNAKRQAQVQAVKEARAKQQAEWEANKEPNNYFKLFEVKK